MFARSIDDFWAGLFKMGTARFDAGRFEVTVAEGFDEDMRVMMLERADGSARAIVTLEVAELIGLEAVRPPTPASFRQALAGRGIVLHDPDYLFYRPVAEAEASSDYAIEVRALSGADEKLFEAFEAGVSDEDRDAAFVGLDHWAVFGAFEDERLVAAGSMYPWMEAPLADIGVLTLATARGRGFARAVVLAMAAHARAQGLEPQYRCQLDNAASIALAKSVGFALYGTWTGETPRDDEEA